MRPPPEDMAVSGYDTGVSESFRQAGNNVALSRRHSSGRRVRREVADIEHGAEERWFGQIGAVDYVTEPTWLRRIIYCRGIVIREDLSCASRLRDRLPPKP